MLKRIASFFKRQSDSNSWNQTVRGPLNEVSVDPPRRAVQLKRLPVSEQEALSKQTDQKHHMPLGRFPCIARVKVYSIS